MHFAAIVFEVRVPAVVTAASFGSGVFALAAAVFWFWSAATPIPRFTIRIMDEQGRLHATPREIAQARQTQLNALAAFFAGIAALLQVAATWLAP